MKVKWSLKWWLFSWDAFMLGLQWWHWKPLIIARWEEPTQGHTGNYLDKPQVSLEIEFLSLGFIFTIYHDPQ